MLKRLKELLAPAPSPAPGSDKQVLRACAALLIEISCADATVDAHELENVRRVLQAHFGLTDTEAGAELSLALETSERSTSLHSVLQVINDSLSPARKERLIEALWAIAYADSHLDRYEEHQVRRIADLLHVPHHAFIRAKLKAQHGTQ